MKFIEVKTKQQQQAFNELWFEGCAKNNILREENPEHARSFLLVKKGEFVGTVQYALTQDRCIEGDRLYIREDAQSLRNVLHIFNHALKISKEMANEYDVEHFAAWFSERNAKTWSTLSRGVLEVDWNNPLEEVVDGVVTYYYRAKGKVRTKRVKLQA